MKPERDSKLSAELQSELAFVQRQLDIRPFDPTDTVNLMWQHRRDALKEEIAALAYDNEERRALDERCPICDWPLAKSWEKGCVIGNCSYRPDPIAEPSEWRRIQRRRALLTKEGE